jgi:YVTN family beta-propeller protein
MNPNRNGAVLNLCLLIAFAINVSTSTAMAQSDSVTDNVPVNTVIARVPVGKLPSDLVISPDSSLVYVANYLDNTISVINAQTNKVQTTLPAGGTPAALAISSDGSKLYIANVIAAAVTVIDLANGNSTQTITGLAPSPVALALNPNGSQLWVSDGQAVGNIDVIDTASNTVLAPITMPKAIGSLTFTPDGLKTYVVDRAEAILVVDTTSHQVTATIPTGTLSEIVVMSPDGKTAYATRRKKSNTHVMIIDTADNTVTKNITLPGLPTPGSKAALLPNGAYLYVPLYNSGHIDLINTQSQTRVGGGFTAAPFPAIVGIAPNGKRAYVACDSNKVTVVKITE